MTAVLHATRSEHEVAADAVVAFTAALVEAGVIIPWRPFEDAMLAAGITHDDMLAARYRRTRFGAQPPKSRPVTQGSVVADGPSDSRDHSASIRDDVSPPPPASPGGGPVSRIPPAATAPGTSRWNRYASPDCNKCGQDKGRLDDGWCDSCREKERDKKARQVEQAQADEAARRRLVKAVAPAVEMRLTEDKQGFVLCCAACGKVIGEDEAVVCLSCADRRPQSHLGEVVG